VVHAWTTEMTGVGWLSAIRNVVELGDVARFPRRGSLPHYLGLTPSEYSTGDAVQRGAVLRCPSLPMTVRQSGSGSLL